MNDLSEVKYRIVDMRTMMSGRPGRMGKEDVWVTYELEGMVRDTVVLAGEDATPEKAKEAVEAHIRNKLKYIGQEGSVARD